MLKSELLRAIQQEIHKHDFSHFVENPPSVAQLERDLIRERVSAGIRNARANGKKLGRPTSTVDRERILELTFQGQSLRQIAANLGVGYGTVRARLLTSHKI
jgi:DNA invertase Pin-like site-specific DNA recombinase